MEVFEMLALPRVIINGQPRRRKLRTITGPNLQVLRSAEIRELRLCEQLNKLMLCFIGEVSLMRDWIKSLQLNGPVLVNLVVQDIIKQRVLTIEKSVKQYYCLGCTNHS
jgi:hypothetical protein